MNRPFINHPNPPFSPPSHNPSCSSTQSLQQTKQAHAITLFKGPLPNSVSISASLILRYATLGDSSTSRFLFQRSVSYSRTAFLWNTLIRAFSIAGIHDGFEIYNRMVQNGVEPDDHTFSFVLKVCTNYSEVRKGKEVHGLLSKLGFDSDLFVGNTLLLFYGGCGFLSDAEKVFDEMFERDIVLWNTIIGVVSANGCHAEALELFQEIKSRSGFMPNVLGMQSLLVLLIDTTIEKCWIC